MKKKTFEQKVKSMDAYDIIMSMVKGLKNPTTKIKMSTYGMVKNGVCYGCAATNTICLINNITTKDLKMASKQGVFNGTMKNTINNGQETFVSDFEDAIDNLRRGDIEWYNVYAKRTKFSTIKKAPNITLPHLNNNYTLEDLKPYSQLARFQRKIKK